MTIELPAETRAELLASLKRYATEELDLELGDLRAGLFLDYLLAEVGASVYNRAVRDAAAWFQERSLDLEASCHEPEGVYWAERDRRKGAG